MRIERIAVTGSAVPDAALAFGQRCTIVHGASNTGKSIAVSLLDFMMAAESPKRVQEDDGYTLVEMWLVMSNGERLRLTRRLDGGPFEVHGQDQAGTTQTLSPSPAAKNGIHEFLLSDVDLAGKKVLKNEEGETRRFSLRTLSHLCLIDESKIQSPLAPPYFGMPQDRTAEAAALKLLLTGNDDSHVESPTQKADKRKLSKGKADVLGQLVDELRDRVPVASDPSQLRSRLTNIAAEISRASESLRTAVAERGSLISRHGEISELLSKRRERLGEIDETLARFGLLRRQYLSDLRRLDAVHEAGDLMGMFRTGTCVFCGADAASQHLNVHMEGERTALALAVQTEHQKTSVALGELDNALDAARAERTEFSRLVNASASDVAALENSIAALELSLQPIDIELQQLVNERVDIERALATYEQIDDLTARQEDFLESAEGPTARNTVIFDPVVLSQFDQMLRRVASAWSLPGASQIRFDPISRDLYVGLSPRSSQGKGMRALLQAVFTVALAEYCLTTGRPHSGFIVLDSPLVTYRSADGDADLLSSEDADLIDRDVDEAMYRYLAREFPGQAIVFENKEPPRDLQEFASVHHFTRRAELGRYGFYPLTPENVAARTEESRL